VPVEYVGLARALWRRLDAEWRTVEPAQIALIERLRERLPRRGFRPKRSISSHAFAAQWSALPSLGTLLYGCKNDHGWLRISEVRAIGARLSFEDWGMGEAEPAIALWAIRIAADPQDRVHVETFVLGDLALHAVARRVQRGVDRSDAAVLRDVAALVTTDNFVTAMRGGEFRLPCASGGSWIGRRVRYRDRLTLAVRTYVEAPP